MSSYNYQVPEYTFHDFNYNYTYSVSNNVPKQTALTIDSYTELSDDFPVSKVQKRIITYYRDEILVVYIDDIAIVYIENSITHVVTKNGHKSVSNYTLDELFDKFNQNKFFRVNRQVILGVSSIEKITKIGNSLKIKTLPKIEIPIIVGKNKVSKFKNWLNQ